MKTTLNILTYNFAVGSSKVKCFDIFECLGDPIKFDLSIDMGHKPVPEGSNATRPVTSEIALPQSPFIGKVRPYIQ